MTDPDQTDPLPPRPSTPPLIEHEPRPLAADPVVVRRGGTPLLLTFILVAALGGGLYWVWTNPHDQAAAPQAVAVDPQPAIQAAVQAAKADIAAAIQSQIQALADRVAKLEAQPAVPAPAAPVPSPDQSGDLAKRLDDLSAHIDALATAQQAQQSAIQKAMEMAGQVSSRSNEPPPPPDHAALDAVTAQAQQQVADLGTKIEQNLAQQKSDEAQIESQQKVTIDTLETRLHELEQGAGKAEGTAQGAVRNADRAIKLEAALSALQSGEPLGDLPGAPPAVARYATAAPPTEAALRAEFPQVAAAARAASRPDLDQKTFMDRAMARVQQSVTIRRGDRVIVGDPAGGVLARAQEDVANGDLKGALSALASLNGPAAAAAADWVARVHALLDARAGLAAMAAHG